jgi:hypothetical protein
MKYKRMIPIQGTGNVIFTVNFNGSETSTFEDAVLHIVPLGGAAVGYTVTTNIPALESTFDQNRCAAIKVKYFPSLPNGAVTAGYQPTYLLRDRDGIDQNLLNISNPFQLQEQVNGVKTLNMYRPFKAYMKAPKHRINSRIPTVDPAFADPNIGYAPNTNLAGQWKRVGESLSRSFTTAYANSVNRGSQMAIYFQRPAGLTGEFTLGNLEVTTYYVYKDRN